MLRAMKLTGASFDRLQASLLSAFPARSALAAMVRVRLEENLDAITSSSSGLNATIFELVQWAESEGRLEALITGARAENPGNPLLHAYTLELAEEHAPRPQAPYPSPPTRPSGPAVPVERAPRWRKWVFLGGALVAGGITLTMAFRTHPPVLRGRVNWANGGPVPSALVQEQGCPGDAVTDPHGHFEMSPQASNCTAPPIRLRVVPPDSTARLLTIPGPLERDFFLDLELPLDAPFPARNTPLSAKDFPPGAVETSLRAAYFITPSGLGNDTRGGAPSGALAAMVDPSLRSIGRIEGGRSDVPYVGTGFLVAPKLLVTAGHVAKALGARATGDELSGIAVRFDAEIGSGSPPGIALIRVRLLHAFWDVAILELKDPAPSSVHPLSLAARAPAFIEGRAIAVVGYPAADPRTDAESVLRVFGDKLQIKRLVSGKIARLGVAIGQHDHPAIIHDAFTMGGNAGSPVIDVATGRVLGVQFASKSGSGSFAVPWWELYQDSAIRALPLDFRAENAAIASIVTREER